LGKNLRVEIRADRKRDDGIGQRADWVVARMQRSEPPTCAAVVVLALLAQQGQ